MKKSKKALLLTVCALALVVTTVFGTMAYMTAADSVSNTFTAGVLVGEDGFKMEEHKVERNSETGMYTQLEQLVDENDYVVVPGVDLPKDPFVTVDVKENAYLFLEVINSLPDGMTAEIDTEVWTPLLDESDQPVKKNGHPIYVPVKGMLTEADGTLTLNVLKDQKVTVTKGFVPSTLADGKDLGFMAFLGQATAPEYDTAFGAWTTLFASLA